MFKSILTHRKNAGFTLFEMLVSVGIIVLISGVVFFNHSKFKSDTELVNVAYRLALSIREAQVYSISVKQFDLPCAQNFNTPYGIHFKQSVKDSYLLFADAEDCALGVSDGVYTTDEGYDEVCDVDSDSECVERTIIGRNITIKGWCGIFWNGNPANQQCLSSADAEPHFLDIKFRRPNPDAVFRVYETFYEPLARIGGFCRNATGSIVECTGWAICLVAPDGKQKQVAVYETGQISVQNVAEGSGIGCDSIE